MPRKKRKLITLTGRPLKEIDWKIVDHKLRAGCSGTTIAAVFGIHADTLYERILKDFGLSFSAYSQQKRMEGDDCIKTTQYEEATVEKNTTLLVWLGKVRLDQKESANEDTAPKKEDLELKNQLYAALYKIQQIEKELSDLKPKTSQELPGSNPSI